MLFVLPKCYLSSMKLKSDGLKSYMLLAIQLLVHSIAEKMLDLGLRCAIKWPFLVAEVSSSKVSILWFISDQWCILKIRDYKISNLVISFITRGELHSATVVGIFMLNTQMEILNDYIEIIQLSTHSWATTDCLVFTTRQTVADRPRKLSGEKLHEARTKIHFLLEPDMIRPFCSPWISPIHLVQKKDDE